MPTLAQSAQLQAVRTVGQQQSMLNTPSTSLFATPSNGKFLLYLQILYFLTYFRAVPNLIDILYVKIFFNCCVVFNILFML